MNNELYHRRYFARSKTDHKYTRREWKNGHWVYYYEDGTNTVGYEKGQNYKTVTQVKAEKQAQVSALADKKTKTEAKAKATAKRNAEIDNKIDSWVDSGKDKMKEIKFYMDTPVVDLIKMRKEKRE